MPAQDFTEPPPSYSEDRVPLTCGGYTQATPGMIIILIDQSKSMNKPWPSDGRTKAEVAADQVNKICDKLASQCRSGSKWLKKVHLSVLGYCTSGNGDEHFVEYLLGGWPDVFGPKVWAGYEGSSEPLIQPRGQGGTPMSDALNAARVLIEKSMEEAPQLAKGFPPTVINITDGEADDYRAPPHGQEPGMDTRNAAEALRAVQTTWGNTLLFNLFIDPDQRSNRLFADQNTAHELNAYGRFLFDISSPVPRFIKQKLRKHEAPEGADLRGLVLTGSPNTIVDLLRWGSFQAPD